MNRGEIKEKQTNENKSFFWRIVNIVILVIFSGLFTIIVSIITLMLPILLYLVFYYITIPFYPNETSFYHKYVDLVPQAGILFVLIVIIILLTGFFLKRYKVISIGVIIFYLPIFSYYIFFSTGEFYVGRNFFLILWYPLGKLAPPLLRLGEIFTLPFIILVDIISYITSLQMAGIIWIVFIALGGIIFFLGSITWLYGKLSNRTLSDFWIYKHSRHPQYLGYLLWSYGMIFLAHLQHFSASTFFMEYELPQPSLFWLITSLTLIGVCLAEEMRQINKKGTEYQSYREITPFLLPLPKKLTAFVLKSTKWMINKPYPDTSWEIILVLVTYGIIISILSLPTILLL